MSGLENFAILPIRQFLWEIYSAAKGPLKQGIKSCITSESDEARKNYIDSISKVKTIWQIDKAVHVYDFYYPTTLQFGKKTQIVQSVEELFQENKKLVIEGIAGQGKSIFLRYLAIKTYQESKLIPVFIQLRHIQSGTKLSDLIDASLTSLGIVSDSFVREYFFRKGKAVFLLDGFDEIHEEYRSETIRFIETNIEKYKNTKVVISSRPNSDIQHSSNFDVVKIKPLSSTDREKLIKTLVVNQSKSNLIINALKGKDKISGILTTPLLVTLLVITYKSESEIPDNLSDFYKSLFQTLVKRHDKTKPGFIRERKSSLGNIDFERVFETLCFNALNEYKMSMTDREFYGFCEKSLRIEQIKNLSAQDFMQDIVNITSLLVLDGDKYYFLHKSIPEYFAAQKISEEKDELLKENFYNQLRENNIPENWYQTIRFLSEIDGYYYVKNLLIPYYAKAYNVPESNPPREPPPFTKESFLSLIGNNTLINIMKYGKNYKVNVRTETKNWLVNTYLAEPIAITFQKYINDEALEWEMESLLIVKNQSQILNYCFETSGSWNRFIIYLNSNSDVKKAYENLKSLINKVEQRANTMLPMLKLHISPPA